MKVFFILFFLSLTALSIAQKTETTYTVSYESYQNGKKSGAEQHFTYQNQLVFLSKATDKIRNFINLAKRQNISTIVYKGQVYKNSVSFDKNPKPSLEKKGSETILGYSCSYASFSYFSNHIEVWYTEKAPVKGSLYSRYLPSDKALVLKIVINGNRKIIATKITKKQALPLAENFSKNAKEVTTAEFEEIKINSRYTQVAIFDHEIINFNPKIKIPKADELVANKTYHFSNGSVIMKKIHLTEALKKNPYIFAKLTEQSNGDAYDRTGSVFIVPVRNNGKTTVLDAYLNGLKELPVYTDHLGRKYQGIRKEKNYTPPIEIMRFFTPFGVNNFNSKRVINNYNWAKNASYKQDVSALIPNDVDEIWVGVFIGNYDSGGHIVSLDLDFYPSDEDREQNPKKFIEPLFSTVNTLEMSGQNYGRLFATDTLEVAFSVEENLKNLQLLYTSTGHGGWGGGDEFNPKLNQLFIDGKEIYKVVPWRTDCATYRLSNPASGNFENGLSSSDLSRSNWCPAALTPPYVIPLNNLAPGRHSIKVVIHQGQDAGGSFSHWGVTGVLIGNK